MRKLKKKSFFLITTLLKSPNPSLVRRIRFTLAEIAGARDCAVDGFPPRVGPLVGSLALRTGHLPSGGWWLVSLSRNDGEFEFVVFYSNVTYNT